MLTGSRADRRQTGRKGGGQGGLGAVRAGRAAAGRLQGGCRAVMAGRGRTGRTRRLQGGCGAAAGTSVHARCRRDSSFTSASTSLDRRSGAQASACAGTCHAFRCPLTLGLHTTVAFRTRSTRPARDSFISSVRLTRNRSIHPARDPTPPARVQFISSIRLIPHAIDPVRTRGWSDAPLSWLRPGGRGADLAGRRASSRAKTNLGQEGHGFVAVLDGRVDAGEHRVALQRIRCDLTHACTRWTERSRSMGRQVDGAPDRTPDDPINRSIQPFDRRTLA